MLKTIFYAFFGSCLLLITSCNEDANTQHPAAPDEEKQLQGLVAKYPDSFLLKQNLIQYYQENGAYAQALATTANMLAKDSTSAALWNINANLYFDNND